LKVIRFAFCNLQKEVSDPECRDVCEKAYETLLKKGDTTNTHVAKLSTVEALSPIAKAALGESASKVPAHVLDFVCGVALSLVDIKIFDAEAWSNTVTPFLASFAEPEIIAQVPVKVCD
jgi:elongation factor 3